MDKPKARGLSPVDYLHDDFEWLHLDGPLLLLLAMAIAVFGTDLLDGYNFRHSVRYF